MQIIPEFEFGLWNAWILMSWLLVQNVLIRFVSKNLYQKLGEPPEMKPSRSMIISNYISMSLWILSTVYSIFLPLQLGTTLFLVGIAVFLFSIVLNISAMVQFAVAPNDKPVTTGVYRFSRHPGYLSILLIYLSVGLASGSWIFLLATVVWAILLHRSAAEEERFCLGKYGQAYHDYIKRTPRWIGLPKKIIR